MLFAPAQMTQTGVFASSCKSAEMSMEDDYSMLDGVINNGKAPQLEDTPSMLGQLKEKAEACKDTPSPKKTKSKER